MRVIVDTSVWSLSLRRKHRDLSAKEKALYLELIRLISEHRAVLIGPIRTEVLSGIHDEIVYERLRSSLRAFEDEPLTVDDFEETANAHNQCMRRGVVGSIVDFLICSVAMRHGHEILTTDPDFSNYARVLPIRLHSIHRKKR